MPKCGSPLHPASGLPATLPETQFYLARGRCFWACKACWCVTTMLRKRHIPAPWGLAIVRHMWAHYWRVQQRRARRGNPPPGHRWCSRGHVAKVTDFRRTQHYCRACASIYAIMCFYRNTNRPLTWEQATKRYAASKHHHTLLRNRLAPPGERWCSRHQGYFLVPLAWTKAWRLSWCNPCRAAYQQRAHRRKRARQEAVCPS